MIVTIDGGKFIVNKKAKYLYIAVDKITHVGQIVEFKKYDVKKNPPKFVGTTQRAIEQTDLYFINAEKLKISKS